MHNANVKQSRKREYETTTQIDRRSTSLWRVHVRREKVKDKERKGENNRLMSEAYEETLSLDIGCGS